MWEDEWGGRDEVPDAGLDDDEDEVEDAVEDEEREAYGREWEECGLDDDDDDDDEDEEDEYEVCLFRWVSWVGGWFV